MSSPWMRSARLGGALLIASFVVDACHRALPISDPRMSADCRAAQAREADTRIHIDGPSMAVPHPGDSVVYIVNDHEVWRGAYEPCHSAPGRSAAIDHVIPATDSVVSLVVEHGPEAAARWHVGGTRVVAYVIRTAPPPE